ncbi:MAG: site-2 protease family protein [Planctomycetes bacterium]|nr:site-2 protease family protein [Planctomycetota bacterium]
MLGEFEFNASRLATLVVLVLSVALHEAAHAYATNALGDDTPKRLGRVTLNPLPHLDPFLSVLLPAIAIFTGSPFIFGAGKPVPFDFRNLRHPARDAALITLAGPASNFVQAALWTAAYVIGWRNEWFDTRSLAFDVIEYGIRINLVLALFNLLPIPPLDGSRVLGWLLPRQIQPAWYALDRFAIFFIVGLVVLSLNVDLYGMLFDPLVRWWKDWTIELATRG